MVVVVAEVEVEVVVVALVAVEALGGVPQGMAVVLPMGPLPLPTAVLVVDTAMDVSSLHTSQPPVLPCCLAGLHAAITCYICHIHMCVLLYSAEIVHSFPTCVHLCSFCNFSSSFLAFSAFASFAGCFCVQANLCDT